MNKVTFQRHPLFTGTLLLTLAGLLSRIIGFFYRIFLSHTIGAEGLGIYQLIFPIYALTFSVTVAGVQTAISKYVAEAVARDSFPPAFPRVYRKSSRNPASFTYLYAGLFISLLLSFLCTVLLYLQADFLAIHMLGEARCGSLLRILSLTVPFGAIHASINGYYYGLKKTAVPAISQLLEQMARVGGVWLLYRIASEQGRPVTIQMAVWGLVIGEIVSVLYSASFTRFQRRFHLLPCAIRQVFTLSLPLTANRVFVNLFASAEAILIPIKLRAFGYSSTEALSVFGVLTGMAMPMIFFPSVITNSVSVMLLPAISEAAAKEDMAYIKNAVKKSCLYCIILGLCCTLGFLIFGRFLGTLVFANHLAGTFIVVLGWICPFLYLTTTLSSIINGLGKTSTTFLLHLTGSAIRILFVVFLIPTLGIKAYLFGILVSHLVESGVAVLVLRKHLHIHI